MQTKLLTSFEWSAQQNVTMHADIIKWKHFPCYWPFVHWIHQSMVNSLHKDQWHGTLMFSLICTWTNVSGNNWDTSGWRRHCAHYDVTLMYTSHWNYISHHKVYCAGNSPVNGEFPSQRPLTRSFDVFFDLRLNKWFRKQLRYQWHYGWVRQLTTK